MTGPIFHSSPDHRLGYYPHCFWIVKSWVLSPWNPIPCCKTAVCGSNSDNHRQLFLSMVVWNVIFLAESYIIITNLKIAVTMQPFGDDSLNPEHHSSNVTLKLSYSLPVIGWLPCPISAHLASTAAAAFSTLSKASLALTWRISVWTVWSKQKDLRLVSFGIDLNLLDGKDEGTWTNGTPKIAKKSSDGWLQKKIQKYNGNLTDSTFRRTFV